MEDARSDNDVEAEGKNEIRERLERIESKADKIFRRMESERAVQGLLQLMIFTFAAALTFLVLGVTVGLEKGWVWGGIVMVFAAPFLALFFTFNRWWNHEINESLKPDKDAKPKQ